MSQPISKLAMAIVLLVALLHIGFLILEMFYWNHPVGQRIFSMTPEVAESSAVLAANQGLYNGFLAAGLLWGLLKGKRDVIYFFLSCVIVAGVFGAITAKPTILFTQAMPAALGMLLVWISGRQQITS